MNTVVLATGNAGKIRELSAMLAALAPGIRVLGLKDFPQIGDIPETGDTFEANARIKALAVARATGLVAVADDSGLSVDALSGAPGVHSARYSGENATDKTNTAKLLDAMCDVPDPDRSCHFACVMLATTPDGQEAIGRGAWPGLVAKAPRGTNGFGYDPVFFDPKLGCTAAEMDADTKNGRSHRRLAMNNLLALWPDFWARAMRELEEINMCGIIGYSGHRPAIPAIVEGLRRLEYRGYDSAGVAYEDPRGLHVIRAEGKLGALDDKIRSIDTASSLCGIGHTRWATHGLPVERNAHPHMDGAGRFALVHNGIIENYAELKAELQAEGHVFLSETDTEVLVHVIAKGVDQTGDVRRGISWALGRVDGAYAFALLSQEHPGVIWASRKASPLLMGVGEGENFVASDIPAFLPYTREVVFLDNDELVEIDASSWQVFDIATLEPKTKEVRHISWDVQAAQKDGYKHFMLKEIFEQPKVIRDCLAGRVLKGRVALPELDALPVPKRLTIVACGTSYHAGLWAKYLLETWARIPVQVEIASEFRYRDSVFLPGDLVLTISQSGETADTLAAIRIAREAGAPILGLCNVVGSSIARESDSVVYTQAGPEISVASTKAMCSQMVVLLLMTLAWAARKGTLVPEVSADCLRALTRVSDLLEAELPAIRQRAKVLCQEYSDARSFFFLGALYFPLALEGALKLKEISYIHAEGYASGEMKHGPIALIDAHFPTFAMALNDDLLQKVASNLQEVQARGGRIIALVNPGAAPVVESPWVLPEVWGPLKSFLVLPAVQLFAYEMAVYLGKDVDQPRNLAKSVTVE